MEIELNVENNEKVCEKIRIFYDDVEITSMLTGMKLDVVDERVWSAINQEKDVKALDQLKKLIEDLKK